MEVTTTTMMMMITTATVVGINPLSRWLVCSCEAGSCRQWLFKVFFLPHRRHTLPLVII